VAEAIENNVRKTIVDENPVNPKYYEKMSALLDELIERRRQQAIDYQKYLQEIRELAQKVLKPAEASSDYPASINTGPKRALYDNLGEDEELVLIIDRTIQQTKKADWVGNRFKEREIIKHLKDAIEGRNLDVEKVMVLAKAQKEYH
jgi:type I restriction enzyme R subunit